MKKSPRFSAGVGQKREFGMNVLNKDGWDLYQGIKKTWSHALSDKNTWLWLDKHWNEWVSLSGFCRHWTKRDGGGAEIVDERVEEREEEVGMLLLPGDDGFACGKDHAWNDEDLERRDGEGLRKDDAGGEGAVEGGEGSGNGINGESGGEKQKAVEMATSREEN